MWSGKKMANSLEKHHICRSLFHQFPLESANTGLLLAGIFTTGENVVREKYGEIVQNPPLYTVHNNPE